MWTPELQAEFIEIFYTVCFSHPKMDSINYWVMGQGLQHGTGLLDDNLEPKPGFYKLKELITKRWRTNLDGRATSDGSIAMRGFHGDYEIEVTLPNGKTAKSKFSIKPAALNQYRLKLSADGNLESIAAN